jgi:maltokinase
MMASALLPADALPDLAQWIAHRRWFATKADPIERIEILSATALASHVEHVIVRVHSTGGIDDYQLLLATAGRDHAEASVLSDSFIRVGDTVLYEGFGDHQLLLSLQQHFANGSTIGALHFHVPGSFPIAETARVISSEQSNSSVIYGDTTITKFYRRLTPGLNPDLEVGQALDAVGSSHTPRVLGWLSTDVEGVETTLAVAHQFMATAVDGFEHALVSVRDLIATPDTDPSQAGGNFAGEALRLGEAIAEVHRDLATAFGTTLMSEADAAGLVAGMHRRLDESLEIVADLSPFATGLREIYAAIGSLPISLQRIHGDLHLGQVLRDTSGWIVLDFEGEPGSPLEDRRRLAPALRDVAGMLRSFDYAARQPLINHPAAAQHLARTAEWTELNRASFLEGYLSIAPVDLEEAAPLMRALEAEKAVYETVYEHRFRPDWIGVPLGGLERLVEGR